MKKIIIIVLLASLFGCIGAKYTTSFEKGSSLDFTKGKWVLNEVYEKENSRMYDYALKSFGNILGDSLFEIHKTKNISSNLMKAKFPFNLTKEELKEIKVGTKCNYLINIKGSILKDDMSGFVGATSYGVSFKSNIAKVDILIYDLDNLEIISNASVIGKYERTQKSDQSWDIVTEAKTIKIVGLNKLIKKYQKNRIKS